MRAIATVEASALGRVTTMMCITSAAASRRVVPPSARMVRLIVLLFMSTAFYSHFCDLLTITTIL